MLLAMGQPFLTAKIRPIARAIRLSAITMAMRTSAAPQARAMPGASAPGGASDGTLPVYIYYSFTQPGTVPFDAPPGAEAPGIARAWGAALVLIVIVMALNLIARLIGRIFAVKKG